MMRKIFSKFSLFLILSLLTFALGHAQANDLDDDFSEFTDFEEEFSDEENEVEEPAVVKPQKVTVEEDPDPGPSEKKKASFNPFPAPPKEEKKVSKPKPKIKSPDEIQREQGKLKDIISGSNILRELIENPSLSLHCKDLLKTRDLKYKHLQKIKSLNKRTELLLKKTPPHKKIIRKKAELSKLQLVNEKKLTNFKIANIEEKIIRSGCPGIHLK